MPHVDGFEIMEGTKKIELDSYTPILVLTAESELKTRLKALQMGARDFLSKPLDLSEVLCRINNLLEVGLLNKSLAKQNATIEKKVLQRTEDLNQACLNLQKEISERIKSEIELDQVNQQLLHSEKLSALGQLAANIAHELNNPLMGIRNTLDQVNQEASLEPSLQELVGLSITECNRVMSLTLKLKDFYRPSPGTRRLLDIHSAINDMLTLKNKDLQNENIKLVKDYSEGLPEAPVIEDQFKQVILNLLHNASEASTNGGTLTVRTKSMDDSIEIDIEDNSPGIPQKNIKRLFDPFFTTKGEVKGTGLGLSVSYGIIRSHGGNIKVKTTEGNGATFTMSLPISERNFNERRLQNFKNP